MVGDFVRLKARGLGGCCGFHRTKMASLVRSSGEIELGPGSHLSAGDSGEVLVEHFWPVLFLDTQYLWLARPGSLAVTDFSSVLHHA